MRPVDVIGQVDSIDDYLYAADAMILPSDQPEPFGLVVILGSAPEFADLLRRLTIDDLCVAGVRARASYLDRNTPESYRRRVADAVASLWQQQLPGSRAPQPER